MLKRAPDTTTSGGRKPCAPVKDPNLSSLNTTVCDDKAALYRLMTWLSPSFPVGSFSYSSGIEWAVEAGDIADAGALQQWLEAMLMSGAGYCDAVFLAHAHRHAAANEKPELDEIIELSAAFVSSRERRLETLSQGQAFIKIAQAAWGSESLDRLLGAVDDGIVYPIAVGVVSAAHGVPLEATVHAFLHAQTVNWISAAARLVPLGQTESQRVLASLEITTVQTGERALSAHLDDLASFTFRADIASMKHETQYTRLFRS